LQMKRWQELFPGNGLDFMSVNLAHKQILQPDLVDHVASVLKETGLRPEHLKLEITENVLFENPESAATLLTRLRNLGVQLYIDDFGTGYSSLSYLDKLPLDELKIDRSFLAAIKNPDDPVVLVDVIIAMAHSLGLRVVAEGVETREQLEYLTRRRCDEMQGYLVSKPVSADEFAAAFLRPGPAFLPQ